MTFAPPTLPGLGNASGFDLRILAQAGQSSAELEQVTREILQLANQHPQLSRVFTTWSSNVPQLTLTVDRDRAALLDVPVAQIFSSLQTAFGGTRRAQANNAVRTNFFGFRSNRWLTFIVVLLRLLLAVPGEGRFHRQIFPCLPAQR